MQGILLLAAMLSLNLVIQARLPSDSYYHNESQLFIFSNKETSIKLIK